MNDMPSLTILFERFGLALFLGLLIGLEREREKVDVFAGIRTFALISLLGAALAFVSEQFIAWTFLVGFVAITAFALVSHYQGYEVGRRGITTEVTTLLAYTLGGMVYWNMLALAAAITVVVVLLLTFKPDIQAIISHISREDIQAGIEFAVVWVVVLPLLPNRTFGPLDVLNPREIWLMVVFVAAINLGGYIFSQIYGARRGIGIAAVLGGMVSSTAVTFEFARRSRDEEEGRHSPVYALAIAIASTGMFFRALVLAFVINPRLGQTIVIPALCGALIIGLGVLFLWQGLVRPQGDEDAPSREAARSPFALRPALQFGAIFAIVLFISKASLTYLGDAGAYVSSVLGGIAGVDAVVLSFATLAGGGLASIVAARGVMLAAAASMFFKAAVAGILGRGPVRRYIPPFLIISGIVGVVAAFVVLQT
jgi:uncharacterized membrane protein (DUF4010 family)